MKKFMKLTTLVFAFMLLFACSDGGGGTESKTYSKDDIEREMKTLTDEMDEVKEVSAVKAINYNQNNLKQLDIFSGINIDTDLTTAIKKGMSGDNVKPEFISRSSQREFDFDASKGVYEWNSETNSWDIEKGGDKVIVKFPSEGSATNNITITVHAYSEVEIDSEVLITRLRLDIKEDGAEQVNIDLNASYNEEGDPVNLTLKAKVEKYEFNISTTTEDLKDTFAVSVKKDGSNIVSVSIEANYSTKEREMLTLLKISASLKNITIDAVININKFINGMQNITNNDEAVALLENCFQVKMLINSDLAARLKFRFENEEPVPYIWVSDGTEMTIEEFAQMLDLEDLDFGDLR